MPWFAIIGLHCATASHQVLLILLVLGCQIAKQHAIYAINFYEPYDFMRQTIGLGYQSNNVRRKTVTLKSFNKYRKE